MYPYLFKNEHLPMYGIMLGIGLICAVLLFKFICTKKKVSDTSYNFYSFLAVISIACGLVFSFVFQAIYNWIATGVLKMQGMTFMGGLIGGAATFVLGTLFFAKGQTKRDFWKIASFAAPCIVTGHIFGRIGCFLAGCCYGKPTNSWIGVRFPDLTHANWYPEYAATGGKAIPTQLIEAIFLACLLAVMLLLLFKFKKDTILLVLYGICYAVFRFIIEFFRGDDRGEFLPFLSPSQWQSILLLAVSVALAILVYKFKIIPFSKAPLTPKKAPPDPTQPQDTTQQPQPTPQQPTTPPQPTPPQPPQDNQEKPPQ